MAGELALGVQFRAVERVNSSPPSFREQATELQHELNSCRFSLGWIRRMRAAKDADIAAAKEANSDVWLKLIQDRS